MELRVSSVSLCFCLSLVSTLPFLFMYVCVYANSQALDYPTKCILLFVFEGCCWVTATLPLCLGELWIAINQWHTVSQLPGWLHCHISVSGLMQSQECLADWTQVSVSFLLSYHLISLFLFSSIILPPLITQAHKPHHCSNTLHNLIKDRSNSINKVVLFI